MSVESQKRIENSNSQSNEESQKRVERKAIITMEKVGDADVIYIDTPDFRVETLAELVETRILQDALTSIGNFAHYVFRRLEMEKGLRVAYSLDFDWFEGYPALIIRITGYQFVGKPIKVIRKEYPEPTRSPQDSKYLKEVKQMKEQHEKFEKEKNELGSHTKVD